MKIDSAPLSARSRRAETNLLPEEVAPSPNPQSAPLHLSGSPRPLSGRSRRWIVLGVAAVIVIFLLAVHSVLRPFVWAGVVAYVLSPLVSQVQRRLRIGRGWSVTLVMLTGLGLVSWGVAAAIPIIRGDISGLANSLTGINTYLTTYLPNAGTLVVFGIPVQVIALIHNAQTAIADLPRLVLHDTFSVASMMVTNLLRLLTFVISTFYLLLDGPRLGSWLRDRIPAPQRGEALRVARQVNTVLSEYLRAEVILILIMSTASAIALSVLGVHFALVLAPIVGFLEIFPIVGPFFAIAMVAIVALVGPANFGLSHVGYAVVVALVFFVMRQLEDYLVIPNVVGHAVKLHPVIILFALLCGAALAGILGMFLAVPVTGALKVMGSYVYDRLVE